MSSIYTSSEPRHQNVAILMSTTINFDLKSTNWCYRLGSPNGFLLLLGKREREGREGRKRRREGREGWEEGKA